ncbi:MAG: mechanosensitive ion channel [bacterium]|nr:mechanosensitive ion channel [bacterium]
MVGDPFNFDQRTLNILVYFVVAVFLWILVQLLNKSLVNAVTIGTPRGKRLRTLSSIIKNTLSTIIIAFLLIEILSQFGISLAPILASASIIGLAVGFGAQTLIKDVISGFFLLAEDQFDEGDEISVNDKRGVVEKVTLRTVWLRDKEEAQHIIPNGSIAVVSNYSRKKKIDRADKDS